MSSGASGSIAALPMYDWPEVRTETDQTWTRIREALSLGGIDDVPFSLSRGPLSSFTSLDLMALWTHPSLLLAQTCWGPMEAGLAEQVVVVGQPSYSAYEGGEGPYYRSAILASKQDMAEPSKGEDEDPEVSSLIPRLGGRRFAFNSPDSMSGLIALKRDLDSAASSMVIFAETIETGSHRASIKAVAGGRADICAIDCRTWDLAKRFEPEAAEKLQVIGWTSKRLGLPYISSRQRSPEQIETIRKVLAAANDL